MRIFLVGFMGAGKSTYGKLLAEKMNFSYTDLDAEIEKQSGKSISEFFAEGEENFRKVEAEVLRKTSLMENVVIATGGGAACYHNNMDWMNEYGTTIYLKLLESELANRLIKEKEKRPLIKDLDERGVEDFIFKTLNQRAAYYNRAEFVIQPLLISAEVMAEELLKNQ